MTELVVKNLHVNVEGKEIIKGLDLSVKKGDVTAVMGPNGSGKSTLAYAIMGHPGYEVTKGRLFFGGKDITMLPPNERAKLGLFLSFQYPVSVSGVSIANFLRTSLSSLRGRGMPVSKFYALLYKRMDQLKIPREFAERYINEGFSGGEKKKTEALQLAVIEPKIAILDETDSGTDIDALKLIAKTVKSLVKKGMGSLVITHYQRFLEHIKPGRVHIMVNGKIVKSGGHGLVKSLEKNGYEKIIMEAGKESQKNTGINILRS